MKQAMQCYGHPPPGVKLEELVGTLIVIEGPDSAGRSTHIGHLTRWLEEAGYPVAEVGLKRSQLVSPELEVARQGNVVSPRTMSLFYATDFYDQLENRIVPALRAGSVVLADRYVFTLMARDQLRGVSSAWLESLYRMALVPDAIYYLTASPQVLVDRVLRTQGRLKYWESGMDLGLARDWHDSFIRYQRRMQTEFRKLREKHGFEIISGGRSVARVQQDLQRRIEVVLKERYRA